MKYIKSYENLSELNIGDYVIANNVYGFKKDLREFLENNVGKIKDYNDSYYDIIYKNVPINIKNSMKYVSAFSTAPNESDGIFPLILSEMRLATKEEIDDYLLKNVVNNYNL